MEHDDYQDEIREFALRFSATIQRDPAAFQPVAQELLAIPKAQLRDVLRGPGQRKSPFSERSRRLLVGWERAQAPFKARTVGREWNFALFTLQHARRIALLTALTFDAEFDGVEVGLSWPLHGDRDTVFDGRGATWMAVDTTKRRVLIIREAARLLDRAEEEANRIPPLPPLTEQQQRFRDLMLERAPEDLITSDALCDLYEARFKEATESSNFRQHHVPVLQEWGLKSYGRKGYAFPAGCLARRWARRREDGHR